MTQAQIEAVEALALKIYNASLPALTLDEARIIAQSALDTGAAQAGEQSTLKIVTVPKDLYYHEVAYVRGLELALEEKAATIERCAQYHDHAAWECEQIAAVNKDNDLGADCLTRAIDHREDAAAIRKLKDAP